jgi:tetratricopeptide (TPR) repeat protein
MGRLFLAKGGTDVALQQFEEALQGDPRFIPALLGRAEVLAHRGQVLRARTDMEAVLRLEPGNVAARLSLARLYKGQGLLEEAGEQLRAAARSDGPMAPDVLVLLGELILHTGSAAEARGYLQRAVALRPGDAGGWSLLGLAFEKEGRVSKAIAAHRRAAELDGYSPAFLTRLARALRGAGLLDGALQEAGRSVALDPLEVEPYLELAAIHTARRDYGAAATSLERALRVDPGNIQALRDLEEVREMINSRS